MRLAGSSLVLVSPTALLAAAALLPFGEGGGEGAHVRGVTISCQTWGQEWGFPGFDRELSELQELGVNWVAIHPYAGIGGDGSVRFRGIDPDDPPEWLARPVAWARERGMGILVKPHLAYWGSPFSWRGEIDFESPSVVRRFFEQYSDWIVQIARATREADAFAVGTELDQLIEHEAEWREVIAAVRDVTEARLTYAANWTDYQRVGFWDDLDAIGVQAYFPIAEVDDPAPTELELGWQRVLEPLRDLHGRTGKPVVFTELGYNLSLAAAREPWAHDVARGSDRERALELQLLCYRTGLEVLEREKSWLRGAFLWKWFVGEPGRGDGNFLVDTPELRGVLREAWGSKR